MVRANKKRQIFGKMNEDAESHHDNKAEVIEDPISQAKRIKKQEICRYYAENLGVSEQLMEWLYDVCSTMPEKELKKWRKGQLKPKLKFNRPEFENGQIVKSGEVRDTDGKLVKEINLIENEESDIIEVQN